MAHLGAVAGGLASRRVPPNVGGGDIITSWWNPTSVATGVLAVGTTAYLAAVYLTADARRAGEEQLAEAFRLRALVTGVVVGALTLGALFLVRLTAALAVTAVIWGGGAALYPVLLPGLTAAAAAGDPAVLQASLWALGIGNLLLVPSLLYLFAVFQSERYPPREERRSA